MLTVKDPTILKDFEQAELEDPLPAKVIDATRTVYTSQKIRPPNEQQLGYPVLCDFGSARIGEQQTGLIQPELYRAPEVLFSLPWSYSADIWNLGVFMWDLVEDKRLFDPRDDQEHDMEIYHAAEMIAYLGHPSLEFVRRGNITRLPIDVKGKWKDPFGIKVPQTCLEDAAKVFEGAEKSDFLEFLRMMLKWVPEERASARRLLASPWMKKSISHL